jgi:hypothetical protein
MADLRQAKDRRAKRLAIGGVVVLAAVLAFEVPKVMKSSGGSSSPPPAASSTATAGGASTTPGTTAPGAAAAAAAPVVSTKLTSSDVAPRRLKSQLYSFSHFAGKDPFIQQVSASDITSSPAGTSGSSSGGSGSAGGGSSSSGSSGSGGGSSSSYTAPAKQASNRTLAQTGSVVIQVNGKMQTVRMGASFPSSNPLFTLVSVSRGVARIGIANGSYASGAQTVSLAVGRSLTLVDTVDNVRYKLGLVSAS